MLDSLFIPDDFVFFHFPMIIKSYSLFGKFTADHIPKCIHQETKNK